MILINKGRGKIMQGFRIEYIFPDHPRKFRTVGRATWISYKFRLTLNEGLFDFYHLIWPRFLYVLRKFFFCRATLLLYNFTMFEIPFFTVLTTALIDPWLFCCFLRYPDDLVVPHPIPSYLTTLTTNRDMVSNYTYIPEPQECVS